MGRQKGNPQRKEKEESPERELNELEASSLTEKEFRVFVIRMFKRMDDKYTQLNENYKELNENVTNMKRNQEEMKNNIAAIKNTMEGLKSRVEEAEDRISELENQADALEDYGREETGDVSILLQEGRVFPSSLWDEVDAMGQTQTTPLSIMIDHFKEVKGRASNLSVEVRKGRWQTFCSRELPTFSVGWPLEGTFDLPTIHRVRDIISQPKKGHPNQLPYIITWQDLVEDPSSWLKPFLSPRPPEPKPILALEEMEKVKEKKDLTPPSEPLYPVLQGGTEEELIFPPPYHPPRSSQGGSPPPPGEADMAPAAERGGAPAAERGGVPVPAGSPPLTRQRAQRELFIPAADSTVKALPLPAAGPPDVEGNQPFHYWPFATSDLYNWKAQNPKFSEKPAGLIDLLDSVLFTHQPIWDDCQQLLQVLFTTEERERILNEARKLVPAVDGNPTTNTALIDASFPLTRPEWDFNTAEGKERLWVYRQTLMGGKLTNLAKVGNVQQERDKSLAAFLEQIMEAFRTYTPMDPEAPNNRVAVVMAFVNQLATDIRRKLQKVDRLGEKSLKDLLEVAEKILLATTADSPEERNRHLRRLAGSQEDGKGTARGGRQKLQKDQCAYCREIGHWKQECPKRASKKGGRVDRGSRGSDPLPEHRVTLRVEGTPIDFLVDTGAQHSVLRTPQGKLANKKSWVQGATGMSQYSWTTQRTVDLGMGLVSHSFMVIPECPYPLLGRDLLTKIGAQITFRQGGPQVTYGEGHPIQILTMKLEDEYRLHKKTSPVEGSMDEWLQEFPTAWAEVGLAVHRAPVLVELKPGEGPVRIKQYPMPQEARKGIQPHVLRLRGLGVPVPCQSTWNTPLLPVKKPHTNDYWPVQDLREINKRVMDRHPKVPNPYTLLSSLAPSCVWYTVLDLKDAFFSLPLAPRSQPLFAFEWHDPEEGYSGQLTWTRLPQGFKNSPTIFDEALHEDLGEYRRTHLFLTLLQYVDDILIAADTAED
ncbi:hypothetical protein QTO34_000706 [Cnephaeus nilssonii]|uniref:Uncharacterized protein n=1 Tax=Cnephaeus nilssonii TaxID=3371016 RepID=A0AA40LUL8_CNENI|nr:hypothetical protein QTO34_000706 [Eptesicus nilssonii]